MDTQNLNRSPRTPSASAVEFPNPESAAEYSISNKYRRNYQQCLWEHKEPLLFWSNMCESVTILQKLFCSLTSLPISEVWTRSSYIDLIEAHRLIRLRGWHCRHINFISDNYLATFGLTWISLVAGCGDGLGRHTYTGLLVIAGVPSIAGERSYLSEH